GTCGLAKGGSAGSPTDHEKAVGELFPEWDCLSQSASRESAARVHRLRDRARALPSERAQPFAALLPAAARNLARLGAREGAARRYGRAAAERVTGMTGIVAIDHLKKLTFSMYENKG